VYFVDPHLRTPYVYQYNLSVQREILHNTTLEGILYRFGYAKETSLTEGNPFVPAPRRGCSIPTRCRSSTFSYLDTFRNVAQAHYHSMAVGLSKRFTMSAPRQLAVSTSYTYGTHRHVSGFRSRDSRVPYYDWKRFEAPRISTSRTL